jgi:diaminopimelate decarboxylase
MQDILSIGGVLVTELKDKYQTPLYVMDESKIRENCHLMLTSFKHQHVLTEVIYASKAFLNLAMCQLIHQEGLSLDVVSGGELYTAVKAGFPMEKVYMHGNNKSMNELYMALEYKVGRIVIDNPDEFKRLQTLVKEDDKPQLLLRINPGIEAHTHEYIKTTNHTSKFGMSIFSPETLDLIQAITSDSRFSFQGFHTHIGSQIFEENAFIETATEILKYCQMIQSKIGLMIHEINLGGGFGATYTAEDHPFDLNVFFPRLLDHIYQLSQSLNIKTPKVMIEPGRSIVAEAGYTLYTISGTKTTFGGKNYVFVDGSMADHIRTALYQAKYHAVIGNRLNAACVTQYTVTGKACESGDIIIKDIKLPNPLENDLLVVYSTGAYHYSMSSNYNRLLKPAVVFVKDGQSRLVVKRETYQDLLRNDLELGR